MRDVGLKVLKNKLSEYVRLAEGGETILVTDRDRVAAEIGPPASSRGDTVGDAQLAELVRTGLLRPARRAAGKVPASLQVAPTSEVLSERDRGER